jgi:hypothetical protein
MSDAPETKTCANPACGKPFTRRLTTRESKPAFAARIYCSRECSYEVARAANPTGTKTCRNKACGKEYTKRKRESRNEFQGRSYCSLDCRNKGGNNKGGGRILPRRTDQLIEVVREPGLPWRPSGWTREPNVYAGVRQDC